MNESKASRISRLEEHRTASDLKTDYCDCRCHWKTYDDFFEISDEKVIEFMRRAIELDPDFIEKQNERIKNKPPCTCKCTH